MLASSRSRDGQGKANASLLPAGKPATTVPGSPKTPLRSLPAKHVQVAAGGVTKPQRGPVARASLISSVATLEPRSSASAMYQASYDVTFARSSHTRGAKGA
jgi:hypothetical protein